MFQTLQRSPAFVNMFNIKDLWWSTPKWSFPWQSRHEKIKPEPGNRKFLKMEKTNNKRRKSSLHPMRTWPKAKYFTCILPHAHDMDIPEGIRKRTENIEFPMAAHRKLSVQALCALAVRTTSWKLRWVLLHRVQRPCRDQHDGNRYNPPSHLHCYKWVGFPGAASSPICDNAPLGMWFVSVAVCICTQVYV